MNLLMKCITEGCDEEREITSMGNWSQFVKHAKGHNPRLVNAETGEVLASTPNKVKEILISEGIIEGGGLPEKPGAKPKKEEEKRGKYILEGYFAADRVALDPMVKIYYAISLQEELIPKNTTLGEFITGCIETLFKGSGMRVGLIKEA